MAVWTTVEIGTGSGHLQANYLKSDGDSPVKVVTVIVHGYGEHCGFYKPIAEHIHETTGSHVITYDQVHHGIRMDPAMKGTPYFNTLVENANDLRSIAKYINRTLMAEKIFVYGHSMGGGVVLNTILTTKVHSLQKIGLQGVILEAAYLQNHPDTAPWYIMLGLKLIHMVSDTTILPNELEVKDIAKQEHFREIFSKDPLVQSGMRAGSAMAMLRMGEQVKNMIDSWPESIPLSIHTGDKDILCDPRGSSLVYERVKSKNSLTEMKTYTGALHALKFEEESLRQEFFQNVSSFISKVMAQ